MPGTPADRSPITSAAALAAFFTALHQPAPDGAPAGRSRGGPLADHAPGFAKGLAAATGRGLIDDPDAVRAVWADALAAPPWTGPALWLHGDLHPANVLTTGGALSGVIDFGDLCAGDPAYDISAVWLLLPDGFSAAVPQSTDPATIRRARGWAAARALSGILIGNDPGPGGKPSWAPPAQAALRRLTGGAA